MNNYFESSYLTWEIVPKSNSEFIQKTLQHLKDLEENDVNTWKHVETSDYYFNIRPIGGERPFPIAGLTISEAQLTSVLLCYGLIQDANRKFVEDQSLEEYRDELHHSVSFSNQSYAVFYSAENGILKNLWLDTEDYISIAEETTTIIEMLNHLGAKYGLLLIDWYRETIVDLSDKEKVAQTLNDIAAKK